MSIDLNEIKRKLEALKNNKSITDSGSGGHKYYKPSDKDKIRFIVEPGNDDPIVEYNWHYPAKGKTFICNKRTYGHQDCVICDTASELWSTYVDGGKQNEDMKRAAVKLFANPRYYSAVLHRGHEAEGIKIYGYGKEVAQDFMGTLVDPDYDISVLDAEKGRDFSVTVSEKAGNNSTYTSTRLKASPKATPIFAEGDTELSLGELYEGIPDMKKLFREGNPDDMAKAVDEYLDRVLQGASLPSSSSSDDSDGSGSDESGEDVDPVAAAMAKLK